MSEEAAIPDKNAQFFPYPNDANLSLAPKRWSTAKNLPVSRKVNPRLVSLLRPNATEAGRYHRLRHAVESLSAESGGLVIGITSPLSGDGKTLTAINLAGALSQDKSKRVLLVELDLHQPSGDIKSYLGVKKLKGIGVVDWVMDNNIKWDSTVHRFTEFNLDFISSGSQAESIYELLSSPRLDTLISEARKRYDYTILDTAPVVPVPDSQLISRLVDGFMVVVAADVTPKSMLEETLNLLDPDKVLGLVFNACTPISSDIQPY